MKSKNLSMYLHAFKFSLCLLFLGMFFPLNVDAQQVDSTQVTSVILQEGVNDDFKRMLETKIEALLTSINAWQMEGIDSFGDDSGAMNLRAVVKNNALYSPFDTLYSRVITNGNWYEVPRIYLSSTHATIMDAHEYVLIFTSEAELIDVRKVDQSYDISRIFAKERPLSQQTKSKITTFWTEYERVFEEKDKFYLNTMFAPNAEIIVGSNPTGEKGSTLSKQLRDTYLERLQTRTLTPRNSISIEISDIQMYPHPSEDGLVATIARQQWNSTAYNEEGYVYVVLDVSKEIPTIVYREWQGKPFISTVSSTKFPDPLFVSIQPQSLTKVDSLDVREGILALSFDNRTSIQVPPSKLGKMLEEKLLEIEGVAISPERSYEKEGVFYVPFFLQGQTYQPSAQVTFTVKESMSFNPTRAFQPLYMQHRNEFSIVLTHIDTTFAGVTLSSPVTTLNVDLRNTDSVLTRVKTEDGVMLYERRISGMNKEFQVLGGRYLIEVEKVGFYPQILSKEVLTYKDNTVYVIMRNIALAKTMAMKNKKKSFWTKYRMWILGGTAFLAGGTAAALLFSDDPGALIGLPNPPGRPGVGN